MTLRRTSPRRESNSSGDYAKLPNGEYEGRLIYVADLGNQERNYQGDVKPACQQLSLGIEILGQHVEINGEQVPRVLWSKPFNVFHELTGLGAELKYYNIFNPEAHEGEVADWDAVLGCPCNVMVDKKQSGDREFDNIKSLSPIPARYQDNVAEAELSPAVGDAEDPSNPATMALFGLPKFIHAKRLEDF